MLKIEKIEEGNSIRLAADGSIDRLSSEDFMSNVLSCFLKSNTIVIDMKRVTYLSSAGLRVFAIGQKTANSKGGSLSLINVSDTVFDVLKATGFDRVMEISLAEK